MTLAERAGPDGSVRTIATETGIEAEIGKVWNVLLDFANYGRWNPYMIRIEGEARAGSAIKVYTKRQGASEPLVQTIDMISAEPWRMRWQGGLPDRSEFAGDHWFELVSTGPAETLFRHYEHFSGSRLPEFAATHEQIVIEHFLLFNEALKARCENRPLPDHRGE